MCMSEDSFSPKSFPTKTVYLLFHVCYMPRTSPPPWLHTKMLSGEEYVVKLPIIRYKLKTWLSALSCLSGSLSIWNSAPTGQIFHEIWYISIFQKSVQKIKVSLKSDTNKGYFTCWQVYIFDISLNTSQN